MNENVREQVARAVYDIEIKHYGGTHWDHHGKGDEYAYSPEYEREMAYEITDRIIALVREAMLSDKTLMELRFADDVREGMEAALAAAGFAEKEQ